VEHPETVDFDNFRASSRHFRKAWLKRKLAGCAVLHVRPIAIGCPSRRNLKQLAATSADPAWQLP
jgi:hypothetical protein